MGFREVKRKVLEALSTGRYQHAARAAIDTKNLLKTGDVTQAEVISIISRCNGTHHAASPHHAIPSVTVHVLKRDGWYIKFYFLDPETFFISVHR